jgi:iron(III) transport system permease protein
MRAIGALQSQTPRPALLPRLQRAPGVVVPLLVGLLVGLPVLALLVNSFNTAAIGQPAVYGLRNWRDAFSQPLVWEALWNSLALGLVRTAIALPLAIAFAWLIARTDMPGRSKLEILCWLGIFLPTLPLAFGWILLLDPQNGLVNGFLQDRVGVSPFNIYSFWGITWVHLASTAVYYKVILLLPFFRRMSPALEEAARTSGASQLTTLCRVTLPILAPALLGIGFLSFVRSLEVFEVELLLGLPAKLYVYSTLIYDLAREQPPHYGDATAMGFVFLAILLGLAFFYQLYIRRREFTTVTGRGFTPSRVSLGRWRYLASAACFVYVVVSLGAPTLFLVLGSFMRRYGFFQIRDPFTLERWQGLFGDPAFFGSVRNSLIIAASVAIAVILIYSLVAYSIVRTRTLASRITDLLAWLPWAVPGILMSLAMLWLILATPLRTILYGTLVGIILALVVKDSPLSTQMFKAATLQVGKELEESAHTSGAGWFTMYRRVLLPLLAPTAATVGVLAFLSSIRDISTPALLYTASTRPISILMLEYSFNHEFERAAAIGVLVSAFVLLVTLGARRLGFTLTREEA